MTRKSVPPIDPHDLSDQADADRIERIWNRLEPELHASERAVETKTPSRHIWLIAAALAGTFGVGVWIGHMHDGDASADYRGTVPSAVGEKAPTLFATGSMSQAFTLTNGGKLLLQPESTVEVGEPSDSGMTLRLLHGSASIEATHAVGGPISIVAGEARLTAPAGGSVEVKRHERDMDVIVSGGTASVESPSGPLQLAVGQSALAVPIVNATAMRGDVVTPHRAEVFRPQTPEPQKEARTDTPEPHATSQPLEMPAPVATTASNWIAKADLGNFDEAANLLDKQGGIEAAIRSTHSAHELLVLGDLARSKHRTDLYAMAARRLVDEFPSDPNSQTVALVLSNYFRDDAKNSALADHYLALAQHGRLGEFASCDELKKHDMSSALVDAAKEYKSRYPQGFCRDTADQILAEAKPEEPKKDEPKDEPKKDDSKDGSKKDDAKDGAKEGSKTDPAPSASAAAKAGPPSKDAPKAPAAPKASASPKD
jgi:hypothetical protein